MARLTWTISAKNDLHEIYAYIAFDSKYYAKIFVDKIRNIAKNLKSFPRLGRIVPEYNIENLREIIFQNYRIIYKFSGSNIYIISIFHASRDLLKTDKRNWEIF